MQSSPPSRNCRDLKRVLLVENPSHDRDRHTGVLTRNHFDLEISDDIAAARAAWQPQTYGLVLVSLDGFGDDAARFCEEARDNDPDQLIAMIFHPDQELPSMQCPTLIFTTEPDEYFLARVRTLTEMAYAA